MTSVMSRKESCFELWNNAISVRHAAQLHPCRQLRHCCIQISRAHDWNFRTHAQVWLKTTEKRLAPVEASLNMAFLYHSVKLGEMDKGWKSWLGPWWVLNTNKIHYRENVSSFLYYETKKLENISANLFFNRILQDYEKRNKFSKFPLSITCRPRVFRCVLKFFARPWKLFESQNVSLIAHDLGWEH